MSAMKNILNSLKQNMAVFSFGKICKLLNLNFYTHTHKISYSSKS